ncbi:MAG: carbamoyl-phosphate synthase domain-containing protein, partial [Rhizobiaceae bacterium]
MAAMHGHHTGKHPMSNNTAKTKPWTQNEPTALLVLADGTVIEGRGAGAIGAVEAEVCFNTAITGYQEILTDPSYQGQIVTFTFPHIGNVGTNGEDIEMLSEDKHTGAAGAIFREPITAPSSYRSGGNLDDWLKANNIIALCDIDTRALTAHIRETGLANAVIAHDPNGEFDIDDLKTRTAAWSGLDGLDLVPDVTSKTQNDWKQSTWVWDEGYGDNEQAQHHVVAIDFGVKRNILRLLAGLDC